MAESEIPKTMLILKSSPMALGVVEIFLRNRGWKLHSTADFKEALTHLMKNKPSYVLISVDHPNKSVLNLPRLLGTNYPGGVFPFAETQASASFNHLNEIVSDYRIYPPVTGPAIERCVNKFLKDQQAVSPITSAFLKTEGVHDSSMYAIKGDAGKTGNDTWKIGGTRANGFELKEDGTLGKLHSITEKASATNVTSIQSGTPENTWVPSKAHETLIARGAERSLQQASDIGDGQVRAKIQTHTNAACIVIDSQRFSGYLVSVMGKDRRIDDEFISSVKEKLFKFLVEHGEDLSHDEAMSLKLKEVEFEPWAIEYAEFLRKSVHKGDEVAMAFFPRRPLKTILEEATHEHMVKIGLHDLHGDRIVEFDLFMYLPTNNKYLLYTPKGGVFYNRQLDRLKRQGVTHMHIQKTEAPAISKYRAENYLNDLVDDYDKNQSLPGKIKRAS